MISLSKVSVYFGGQTLFDDVSFMINEGDRIGLVGKNGAGKTTLLNLISGALKPNGGNVSTSKDLKTGYLTQDLEFNDGLTVLQEAESAFEDVKNIEKEITQLKLELENTSDDTGDDHLEIITKVTELEESYKMLDGFSIQSEITKVLTGLGFLHSDFDRPTNEFSGGWRMRIELAKILLQRPDALLLDEPTNHLDIESIMWLEQWLKNYSGSVMLVSHDRAFLDAVTNRTIELNFGSVQDYKAAYSKYVQLREERQEKQIQSKKNQDKYIKHTKQLIEKFRYKKSKASFAQALIKKLDKLERIEVESVDASAMHFKFPPAPHSGKTTFRAKQISKSYDTLEVLRNVNLELRKEEKIAFVGKNGEGKTTFAKILVNELDYIGDLELGHMVKIGYYAQNQSELLNEQLTVLETIENTATEQTSAKVRNILGSFLFSGDTVYKKIGILSGGERARVALCKLLMDPINFLVMDEPTNHLDMLSKDILKQALIKYDGTLIIVSHDRDFLQGLTEKVYEFKDKNIKEYIGDINVFLNSRNVSDLNHLELKSKNDTKPSQIEKAPSSNKLSYNRKKQLQKDIRKFSNKSGKLENEIEKLELFLKDLDSQLADPEKFKELSSQPAIFDDYQAKQEQLSKLMKDWEKVQQELGKLEKEREESLT
ncbi:ABC-F family ATP-binding cassette domain-containing protein [Sphingobacteriaceae bacterium AH-315-L07]|nr:ABC-F family ATP-binding cassette domain-containing protein [Sphingobacteriaceae bacterium AH-315-L07]